MARLWRFVVAIWFLGFSAAAGDFWYTNSKGERVHLKLAEDRVAVVPAQALWQSATWPSFLGPIDQARPRSGNLWEFSLPQADRGRQLEVAQELVKSGLAQSAGLVFETPQGGTFTLSRGVIFEVEEAKALEAIALLNLSLKALDSEKRVWLAEAADAPAALQAAQKIASFAAIRWALPDFGVPIELYRQVNDPYFPHQWHLSQSTDKDIDADEAWDTTMGQSQVIVAIIDTGVDLSHPDLPAARMVTGYNAVNDSNDPTPLTLSIDAHGTACAGASLASADNSEGVSGVCPGCTLMPIKMMDGLANDTQLSNGYKAINYATEHGAWVLSNSWGIDEQYLDQVDIQPYYTAVQNAVNNGRGGKGAVVLFAAGNGNQMGQAQPIGSRELQNQPYVMTVGGTGSDDVIVGYSDYGSNVSVVAPTGNMNALTGFVGPQIVTTDTMGNAGFSRGGKYYTINPYTGQDVATQYAEIDNNGNYTKYFNGTSAACPIAAGVVALTLSANPNLTGAQARRIVEQTADKVGGPYDANGHNDKYGYGRVNVARAVRAASFGLDQPDGAACAENVNCQSGVCHLQGANGVCITPCNTDTDCPSGFSCQDIGDGTRACTSRCENDTECSPPALCLPDGTEKRCQAIACPQNACPASTACPLQGGYCQRPCNSDADCSGGHLCLPGSGGNVCQSITCTDGHECPAGTACPSGGGTCQRTCSNDFDCSGAGLCLPAGGGNLCQSINCTGPGQCPAGTACPPGGGMCQRVCNTDQDCGAGRLCLPAGDGNLCQQVPCTGPGQCPQGTACPTPGGFCARVCVSDADCVSPALCLPVGDGQLCQALTCNKENDTCPAGSVCGESGYCQRPGSGGGAGGCGCSSSAGGSLWPLLGLAFFVLRRRKVT